MKKALLSFVASFLLIFFYSPLVFAGLKINEFSSYSSSDWLEFYNSGDQDVDLGNYCVRDSSNTNKLSLSGTLGAKQFVSFNWSDKLNKSGDLIKLFLGCDESKPAEDQVAYGSGSDDVSVPGDGQTAGRMTDGGDQWVIFSLATAGSSNNAPVVPTETPTPTDTPTPTRTPTPTKIPTPTRTPTPSKILTPTPTSAADKSVIRTTSSQSKTEIIIKPTPKISLKATIYAKDVLGSGTKSAGSPKPVVKSKEKSQTLIKGSSATNYAFIIVPLAISIILLSCAIIIYLKISGSFDKK